MLQFCYLLTADGSPTVRIDEPRADGLPIPSESMHSMKGAFSETAYIYGSAVELCLTRNFTPRVLSLGLGLGYVEIMSAALFLRHSEALTEEARLIFLSRAGGESFEAIPELRDWFQAWLFDDSDIGHRRANEGDQAPRPSLPNEFKRIYSDILARTSEQFAVSAERVKTLLRDQIRGGQWRIHPALSSSTSFSEQFGCICFDAFSSKTSPALWTDEFLQKFITNAASDRTVFSTYACTGALKRALRAAGFDVQIRPGFSTKRDSTFAVREAINF